MKLKTFYFHLHVSYMDVFMLPTIPDFHKGLLLVRIKLG